MKQEQYENRLNKIFCTKELLLQYLPDKIDKFFNIDIIDFYIKMTLNEFYLKSKECKSHLFYSYFMSDYIFENIFLLFLECNREQYADNFDLLKKYIFNIDIKQAKINQINKVLSNYSTSYQEEIIKNNYYVYFYNRLNKLPTMDNFLKFDKKYGFLALARYAFKINIDMKYDYLNDELSGTKDFKEDIKNLHDIINLISYSKIKNSFYKKSLKVNEDFVPYASSIDFFDTGANLTDLVLIINNEKDESNDYMTLFLDGLFQCFLIFVMEENLINYLTYDELTIISFKILNRFLLINEIIERNIQDLWKKKQLYKAIFYHNNEYLFNELKTNYSKSEMEDYYQFYKECDGKKPFDIFIKESIKTPLFAVFDEPITYKDMLINYLSKLLTLNEVDEQINKYEEVELCTRNCLVALKFNKEQKKEMIINNFKLVFNIANSLNYKINYENYDYIYKLLKSGINEASILISLLESDAL